MKLYLSSDGFLTKNQFRRLVGKTYREAKIGVIMNAVDWRMPTERKIRYDATRKFFKRIGVEASLIDLRKFYDKSPESLERKLKQFDLLWVRGGNVFFLRYVMKKSGFDKAIKNALASGILYAGESAGALVVGPTLRHLEDADDPGVASKVIWRGIGLIERVPLPHWGNPKYAHVLRRAFSALRREGTKVTKLADGEALLVEGKSWGKVKTNRYWRR